MGEAILFGRGIPVLYDPVFENNSWEKIIAYCQRGTVPEEWKVGDQKAMTINGTEYLIDIIGKDHDDYADGSGKAPLTFQMHGCYGTAYVMGTSNPYTWTNCTMRTSTLVSILGLMPTEVQNAIREVNKLTAAAYNDSSMATTADKLFLLSLVEVTGKKSSGNANTHSGEGSQYAYYANGGAVIKTGGSSSGWWVRSPATVNDYMVTLMQTNGVAINEGRGNSRDISPAFCF